MINLQNLRVLFFIVLSAQLAAGGIDIAAQGSANRCGNTAVLQDLLKPSPRCPGAGLQGALLHMVQGDQVEVGVTGTMVITVIFVMFASIRYCKRGLPAFSYRAASSMRRFIRGFFVGVFCTLYFTGIAVFLGYMGLLQLALGLLGLVLSIVIFVIMLIAFLVTSIF